MNCDHHLGFDFDAELNEYHCHTCGALDLAYEAHKADEKAAADEEATR